MISRWRTALARLALVVAGGCLALGMPLFAAYFWRHVSYSRAAGIDLSCHALALLFCIAVVCAGSGYMGFRSRERSVLKIFLLVGGFVSVLIASTRGTLGRTIEDFEMRELVGACNRGDADTCIHLARVTFRQVGLNVYECPPVGQCRSCYSPLVRACALDPANSCGLCRERLKSLRSTAESP